MTVVKEKGSFGSDLGITADRRVKYRGCNFKHGCHIPHKPLQSFRSRILVLWPGQNLIWDRARRQDTSTFPIYFIDQVSTCVEPRSSRVPDRSEWRGTEESEEERDSGHSCDRGCERFDWLNRKPQFLALQQVASLQTIIDNEHHISSTSLCILFKRIIK